jgi:hypothetical protein
MISDPMAVIKDGFQNQNRVEGIISYGLREKRVSAGRGG